MSAKIQTVTDPTKAKILSSKTRVKILQEIAVKPQSISQLARKLKITPVAVLYHIKKLEKAKFIKVAETTIVNNNFTEKFYKITTSSYIVVINPNLPTKGPVPPKKQTTKQILGISPSDIEKMFKLLGLSCQLQQKEDIERKIIKLLETATQETKETFREILSQLNIKLSAADRQKVEYAAMAAFPIVLDKMIDSQSHLQTLQTIIQMTEKSKNINHKT